MLKLRDKVNPAVEFKNDPMMRELHENRLRVFEQAKNMRTPELAAFFKEKAIKFRKG